MVSDIPAPLTLEEQVCFGLSVADRRVVAVYRPLLEPLGLTHPQYLVMVALWQHGPLTQRDLGRLLQLDSGTLSPLLRRLEAAGLVERHRSREDERVVTVAVTAEGERLRARGTAVHDGVVDRLGLDEAELQQLHDILSRVITATAGVPPGDPLDDPPVA